MSRINGIEFIGPEKPATPPERTKLDTETRLLLPFEIQSLAPLFEEKGVGLPDPETCVFIGCIAEDGSIVAFQVIQTRIHADPVWIAPGYSDTYLALIHATEQYLESAAPGQTVYVNTPPGPIARLAQLAGMQMEKWVTFSKQIAVPAAPEPELDSQTSQTNPFDQNSELESNPDDQTEMVN